MPAHIKRSLHIARQCVRQGNALIRGVNAGARRARLVAGHKLSSALPRDGGGRAAASGNRRASKVASFLATLTPPPRAPKTSKVKRMMRRARPR